MEGRTQVNLLREKNICMPPTQNVSFPHLKVTHPQKALLCVCCLFCCCCCFFRPSLVHIESSVCLPFRLHAYTFDSSLPSFRSHSLSRMTLCESWETAVTQQSFSSLSRFFCDTYTSYTQIIIPIWPADSLVFFHSKQKKKKNRKMNQPVEVHVRTDVEKGPPAYSSAFTGRAVAEPTGVGEGLKLNHKYFFTIPGLLKILQFVSLTLTVCRRQEHCNHNLLTRYCSLPLIMLLIGKCFS